MDETTPAQERSERGCGALVAQALAGSWRRLPPPSHPGPDAWTDLAERLLETGEGALVWWRSRPGNVSLPRQARPFRDAYRGQTLLAAEQEQQLERLFSLLAAFDLQPILVKGWASARLYAEPGLRPHGDIDLCVPVEQAHKAEVVLGHSRNLGPIDLHVGVPDLPDRTWEQLCSHSHEVPLGSARIRVLGPEDHLRLVARHLVRHGAYRPLWLCDVAAALEAITPDFDWDYCLSGGRRLTTWLLWVIGLACRLLGAQLPRSPLLPQGNDPPAWLVDTVLWRWGAGRHRQPFSFYLRHPGAALEGLFYNGLNPIKATFQLRVQPRSYLPLVPIQIGAFLSRILRQGITSVVRRRESGGGTFVKHREPLW